MRLSEEVQLEIENSLFHTGATHLTAGTLTDWKRKATDLEDEVDLWRERTHIERGEWSTCIPHNSAYKTNEGCIRCKNTELEAENERLREAINSLVGAGRIDKDGWLVFDGWNDGRMYPPDSLYTVAYKALGGE